MATAAPDPRAFDNWEDAFQYPIPTTRALEKKLRTYAGENQDKLRSLVGSSYRDLLGTAQNIVDINNDMQNVELLIAKNGQKSDSRVLEKIARNLARMAATERERGRDELSLVSQATLLQRALDLISRLIRSGNSILVAAKLLVIARLLHSDLCKIPNRPSHIEHLGNKLARLRLRLGQRINQRLSNTNEDRAIIVECLTAFSLATSSGPTDVLKHFQRLRLNAIQDEDIRSDSGERHGASRRLQLYIDTCRETRALFPDLLRASLKNVSSAPLLKDPSVVSLDELELGTYEQWISNGVRNYTPFTRHDELPKSRAESLLEDWTKRALGVLTKGVQSDLLRVLTFSSLLDVREETLQLWLSSRQHVRSVDHGTFLETLRQPFIERGTSIIADCFVKLTNSISSPMGSLLDQWSRGKTLSPASGLWDALILNMDTSDGAGSFRKAVMQERYGQSDDAYTAVMNSFQTVAEELVAMSSLFKKMKDTRWDDDYDDDEDDDEDDESDDDQATKTGRRASRLSIAQILSRKDPEILQSTFRTATEDSIAEIERWLLENVKGSYLDCQENTSPGIALLRILRNLRYHIPRLRLNLGADSAADTLFCQQLLQDCQTSLVKSVNEGVLEQFSTSMVLFAEESFDQRELWDGTPSLPVMPLSITFKHLRAIVKRMSHLGPDLWSPDVLMKLRKALEESTTSALASVVEKLEEQTSSSATEEETSPPSTVSKTNGDTADDAPIEEKTQDNVTQANKNSINGTNPDEPNTTSAPTQPSTSASPNLKDQAKDKSTQLAFDALYLSHAFACDISSSSGPLTDLITRLQSSLPANEAERIRKSAAEYWRRTYLLFGLLAS